MKQIWGLTHFGFPDWLGDIVSNVQEFACRFADYAVHALQVIEKHQEDGDIWIIPFNEVSFLAWIAGDEGTWMPFLRGRGLEFKLALYRACIAGLAAMRQECRRVKFMHTDPLMYRIARNPSDPRALEWVEIFNQGKYEWFDMLIGRSLPELGGCSDHIDAIALNYYPHNQQDVFPCSDSPSGYRAERMPLRDHRRVQN